MSVIKNAVNAKKFKEDPIGFIVDTITSIIINLVIPIPLAGEIVSQFKGVVLGCLVGLIALSLFLMVSIGTLLLSPTALTSGFFEKFITSLNPEQEVLPANFPQSEIPSLSPLGGAGVDNTTITAGFMDPAYLIKFGKNHFGIDIVPNGKYFQGESYQQNKKVIVYATHKGKAYTYIDQYGGQTVEVTNNEGSLKTVYVHFKVTYAKTGDTINAGTPLGEMGRTGKATGEHVHYEIRIKDGSNWKAVNPLTYIK